MKLAYKNWRQTDTRFNREEAWPAEQFPDAEVHLIEGAEHGFFGPQADEAFSFCLEFLRSHGAAGD